MMRTALIIAVAWVAVQASAAAGEVGSSSAPAILLDRFDAAYGFPTFSPPGRQSYQVPFIFNGPNVDVLRINDVTKIPVINHDTPSTMTHR